MSPLFLVELAVLLVLAVTALVLGGGMALKPAQRTYELLRPVTWAMLFGSLFMTCTGLANLAMMLARNTWSPEVGQAAFSGLGELIVPVMAAFGVLTVAWALAAIGLKRLV